MVPLLDDPFTVTQSPVASELAATDTVFENAVEDVQLTVTWPLCWFCTSMDDADTDATEPKAPGNDRPPGPPPALVVVLELRACGSGGGTAAAGGQR